MKEITIYTDGGCDPNPGPGAWGAVILLNGKPVELMRAYKRTTNNRMELRPILAALEWLQEPHIVRCYSDSKYAVKSINLWMPGWKRRGWKRAGGPLLNDDLFKQLDVQRERHRVTMIWVRGHNGNRWNEHCDRLTWEARTGDHLEDTRL